MCSILDLVIYDISTFHNETTHISLIYMLSIDIHWYMQLYILGMQLYWINIYRYTSIINNQYIQYLSISIHSISININTFNIYLYLCGIPNIYIYTYVYIYTTYIYIYGYNTMASHGYGSPSPPLQPHGRPSVARLPPLLWQKPPKGASVAMLWRNPQGFTGKKKKHGISQLGHKNDRTWTSKMLDL